MPHIHSDSEYDYTVSGNIVFNNKLLLIKHKSLPLWTPPSGHIELDETPIQALYKEILEESGLPEAVLTLHPTAVSPVKNADGTLPLPFDINTHPIGDTGHQHIDLGYILSSTSDDVQPGPHESTEWKWFSKEELATFEPLTENLRQRAIFAIDFVGGLK